MAEWRVSELNSVFVATQGAPAPGVEMRNLQGMCELANALEDRLATAREALEKIGSHLPGSSWRLIDIARTALAGLESTEKRK